MTESVDAATFPGTAELTHLLVVSDISRSVAFYRDVVGAELVREYGGTSAVFRRCFFRDPDRHLLELSEVPQSA